MVSRPPAWVYVVPAVLSALALLDWPYGYYQFLRIVVTGCCLWIAFWNHAQGKTFQMLSFGALAILFNPIFKIHMERDVHAIFNVVTAIVLIAAFGLERLKPSKTPPFADDPNG